MNRILTTAQVEQYREEGYVIVEGVVDDNTLRTMKNALAELVEQSRAVAAHNDIYDLEPGHTAEQPRVRRIKKPHVVQGHHPGFAGSQCATAQLQTQPQGSAFRFSRGMASRLGFLSAYQ